MQPGSGYSTTYGPSFLPRPPGTFTEGAFGPFSPILPVPVDMPAPGERLPEPRREEYQIGWNLPISQPGSEGIGKLASFATLRSLADLYSVARQCIQVRKDEIVGLDWEITMTRDAEKAYRGDRKAHRDFGERQGEAARFFKRPDPDYDTFRDFLNDLLEQIFVFDAATVFFQSVRGRGMGRGLLGSDLDCLQLVDGETIRPLYDLHGARPRPPAPSLQQFLYGVPRSDYTQVITGRDLQDAGMTEAQWQPFNSDQMMYRPMVRRRWSPYGMPPVERALVPIITGLNRQGWALDYWREGTVPAVYIAPGDATMTPNQVKELQLALNAVAGDYAWHHKIIVLPPGSKTMPQKETSLADAFDNIVMTQVAMAFDVKPMELGIMPTVSTLAGSFATREMAAATRSMTQRASLQPTLQFIADIFNRVLQDICGQRDMQFQFQGMSEVTDQAATTDLLVKQVQSGIRSVDEARDILELPPWGKGLTGSPVVFTAQGVVPFGAVLQTGADGQRTASGGDGKDADTGAHAAARAAITGAPDTRALPPGTVAERQRARGGRLAPAHSMAEGSPGHSGDKPVPKAAQAELEALARHLGKGRHITTWEARHIPPHILASIAEDLGKGLSADVAVGLAKTVVLGATEYAWADGVAGQSPKARGSAGTPPSQRQQAQQAAQRQAQALAQQYAARIQAAFSAAMAAAAKLIAAWAAGTLTVTVAVLIGMIAAEVRKRLGRVLAALWRRAWALGQQAAEDAAGGKMGKQAAREALAAFLATVGADWAGLISDTRMRALADALTAALREGKDPQAIVDEMERILQVLSRSEMIAVTETTRAQNAAALAVFKVLGVAYKRWQTRNDSRVCSRCMANQNQGAIPLDALFASGTAAPGLHPRCRCWLVPAKAPDVTAVKALRRQVDLNGEVTYHDREEEPWAATENAAGGGAVPPRSFVTTGNGVQQDIPGSTPGISAGGEPPRWDGMEPFPYVRDVEGGDDATQGGERGLGSRPGRDWPSGYMDEFRGWWPQGGHGTSQPPGMEVGTGGPRGRAPNAVGKTAEPATAAALLASAPKAKASAVYKQLLENYPPKSIAWVKRLSWRGPVEVPTDLVDTQDEDSWAAAHEPAKVDSFVRSLQAREKVNPVIMVLPPGASHFRDIDGHHREMACRKIGWDVRAYIAEASGRDLREAEEAHSSQVHQGSSPQNKSFTAGATGGAGVVSGLVPLGAPVKVPKPSVDYRKADDPARSCGTCYRFISGDSCTSVAGRINPGDVCDLWTPRDAAKGAKPDGPYVAGLMVRAADTGRVLMLQRAIDDDPGGAAGKLEPPGGHVAEGETLLQGALREFSEETGMQAPQGTLIGSWTSSDGIYRGFVLQVPSEDALDLKDGRDEVWNPDNPDGDKFEAILWVDPADFAGNPLVREEMQRDWPLVRAALDGAMKSAQTPIVSTVHHPLGHEGLWHTPDRHVSTMQSLPAYFQNTARALARDGGGDPEDKIPEAIAAVREWSEGTAFGGRVKVTPEVQTAARRAMAEWEALRASHH